MTSIKKIKSDALNRIERETQIKRNTIVQKFKRQCLKLTNPDDVEQFISLNTK